MFVTFEGPEGAGKSTVISEIARRIRESGRDVLTTREPGEGAFGLQVRELLLHGEEISNRAELFLFLADRAQHVASIIRPALMEGTLVLCDRYADSTYVYQALARGLDPGFVKAANIFATESLAPDLTFLLDLEPSIGLARIANKDRLDAQPLAFHERVRSGFLQLAAEEPNRWRLIDARQPLGNVMEMVWNEIVKRVQK